VSDLGPILDLWRRTKAAARDYVLVTLVGVEGSAYRKPGARMLLTRDGVRAGTISGGCLEAEVCRKAWWFTENGPVVKRFSISMEEEGGGSYGLGCKGTVSLLFERGSSALTALEALDQCHSERTSLAIATIIAGANIGKRTCFDGFGYRGHQELLPLAKEIWSAGASQQVRTISAWGPADVFAEFVPPRQGLFIFGAGDDVKPLVEIAKIQGWRVTVADGRAHLATRARFASADEVVVLRDNDISQLKMRKSDAAVLMTHSYEQDGRLLEEILPSRPRYLGLLGPRKRTMALVSQVAGGTQHSVDQILAVLRSPVGLNLGAHTPAGIAIAIAAEILAITQGDRLTGEKAMPSPSLSLEESTKSSFAFVGKQGGPQ
jgi:xanthine dehydrogenase accessory factor